MCESFYTRECVINWNQLDISFLNANSKNHLTFLKTNNVALLQVSMYFSVPLVCTPFFFLVKGCDCRPVSTPK